MCIKCAPPSLRQDLQDSERQPNHLLSAAVDHHLHIQGPDVTAVILREAQRLPEMFAIFSPALLETRTGADAIAALDAAGIGQGVLLSMAYVFSSPTEGISNLQEVATLTRRENAFNVDAAISSGGRLKAFIGINPLWIGAFDEVRYWTGREGVSGIKLHLANSGVDALAEADLSNLVGIFSLARRASLPLVIHVKGADAYTPQETVEFIEKVLPHAGDLTVQIAHAGGGGGLDDATVTALGLYAQAIAAGAPGTRNLCFDLAAVLVRDIGDAASAALMAQFAELGRSIGWSRFHMGSDWPTLLSPADHNAMLASQLQLKQDEWDVLLNNRASYV